jgi:histone H3/H4
MVRAKQTAPVRFGRGKKTTLVSSAGVEKKERKKYRKHPGTKALIEIRKYQRSTDNLIPDAPFNRLVKDVLYEICDDMEIQPKRMTQKARDHLHVETEAYLTDLLDRAQQINCEFGVKSLDVRGLRAVGIATGQTTTAPRQPAGTPEAQ